MRTWKSIAILCGVSLLLVGCSSNTTETGYTPKKLGMNGSQLRALYAPAFTPESHASETDRSSDVRSGANRPY